MTDFRTLSQNGLKIKFSKYGYAIYRSIANFVLIKITNRSYNQKSKSEEL